MKARKNVAESKKQSRYDFQFVENVGMVAFLGVVALWIATATHQAHAICFGELLAALHYVRHFVR